MWLQTLLRKYLASLIDIRYPIYLRVLRCTVTDGRMEFYLSKVPCELDMFTIANVLIAENQDGV